MVTQRITTRSLIVTVVLGVAFAPMIRLAVFLNTTLAGTIAWLAYPAPTPMFMGSIIAFLLIRKHGIATLTGLITAIAGFGAMDLLCALVIELAIIILRRTWHGEHTDLFSHRFLILAIILGMAGGLGLSSGIFMISAARDALPFSLLLAGVFAKVVIGAVYGALAFYVTKALFNAGINPQGLPSAHSLPSPTA